MKKLLIILFCLLVTTAAYAAMTWTTDIAPTSDWFNSGDYKDIGYQWSKEVETILEAWTIADDTADIFTFPVNGATISNATNDALIFLEKGEDFKWVFAATSITASSTTGVVVFDWGSIVPTANQIRVTPSSSLVGTDTGTIRYDTEDNKFYGRNNSTEVDLGAGAGSPAGSDTHIQYNDGGSFGGTSALIYDDTNIELADDTGFAYGADANWIVNYDDSVDDQLLWITTNKAAAATTDPLWEILIPTTPTADQQVFGIARGSQSSNTSVFTVDEDGDIVSAGSLTLSGTFYQASIASAASGNTGLNIDAAGTGVITIGASSTGKITTDNNVELYGNVELGNDTSDSIDINGLIITNVVLDDGTTDSPTLSVKDATDETCAIVKKDNGDTEVTIPADTDFEIVTGNLAVGDSSPGTASMDGEDFYVEGDSEFDGTVQFDGAVTTASTLTLGGDTTINDQVAIAFNANDEELAVTGTATNMTAAAMMTYTMAAQDSTKHILRLIQTPDADADNEFLLLEDNAGDDKFEIEEGGNTIWTLDAAAIVKIDGDTTANTSTGGALDLDFQTNTNNGAAMTITVQQENSASQAYGILIDLNDDCDDDTFDAIHVKNAAGTNSTTRALVIANNIDDGIVATLGAASQALVIDAAATINTGTAGVIDGTTILSENGAAFINLDVESEADGAGELVHGIYVSLDDDADTGTNELRGLTVATDASSGTGLYHAIVTSGANMDAGLYLQTGYLRVGTGATVTESLGDDDSFMEGTLEVDGKIYADGGVEIDNTLLMTATVEITNNELDALRATPKELVAAPGANQLLEFVSAILILDYDTAAFTETADNMAIEYNNGSSVAASETIESTGFIDQSADTITRAIPVKDPIDAAADIVNKNLVLQNVGDGEFGGGGATTMTVIITYRVHDTLGL